MTEYNEATEKALILDIRQLAGEIGAMHDPPKEGGDADMYNYEVQAGLSRAVVGTLDYDLTKVTCWFGLCLCEFGVEFDDRIQALLDALKREAESQLKKQTVDEDHPADNRDESP